MTGSIAEPRPPLSHRPVLRRLADILPPPVSAVSAVSAPLPTAIPPADPAAPVQVERVLRVAVEVLSGRRPVRQLSAVLRPDVQTYLMTLQAVAGGLQPRLGKVLTRHQGPGALEAVALVNLSTGVRALAARFEEHVDGAGRRWLCTALQLRFTIGDLAVRRQCR
ncbi:MAG: Rv3235 family protein [Pseudonocardiaceae bacterium]